MSERQVACENEEGTLNIHLESEVCEVCEGLARDQDEDDGEEEW